MPLSPMPELVRDHDLHRPRVRRLQQRVEDDDATRPADPRHVGVDLRRAPARVGDENLSHRDSRARREPAEACRERLVVERAEAVEERLEDDGRDEREQEHGQREGGRGRHDPPARQRPRERHGRSPRTGAEHDRHGETLRAIAQPASDALRREAPLPLAPPAPPERERRPDDARERGHERRVRSGGSDRRERRERGEEPVPERGPRQRGEHACAEREVYEQGEIERPVVGAGPRALVRRELVHPQRAYVPPAVAISSCSSLASGPLSLRSSSTRHSFVPCCEAAPLRRPRSRPPPGLTARLEPRFPATGATPTRKPAPTPEPRPTSTRARPPSRSDARRRSRGSTRSATS